MANTAATSPQTMSSVSGPDGEVWSSPNNAKVSDNVYASNSVNSAKHLDYLRASNFGFAIPAGATINGIKVEIERKASFNDSTWGHLNDHEINIIKADGTLGSTNKSAGAVWSTSESYITFGGSTDLWGETWTAGNINDADFGVSFMAKHEHILSVTGYVDHIRITIYYTEAAGPANLKSLDTNLKSNTKSIDTNLISNTKSLDTNA